MKVCLVEFKKVEYEFAYIWINLPTNTWKKRKWDGI